LRLRKNDWIFILVVGAVVGALAFLSTVRKKPPAVSLAVVEHAGASADSAREACLACHAPESGGKAPIDPKTHPTKWTDPKMSCMKCHVVENLRTASMAAREEHRQR